MAGSVTVSQEYWHRERVIICKCTSDASGDVSGTEIPVQGGTFYKLGYVPESGCSNLWDLDLKVRYKKPDASVITWADVLDSNGDGTSDGDNLSNATNGSFFDLNPQFKFFGGNQGSSMTIEPIIANLGNAQTVTLFIMIWEEVKV